MYYTCKFTIFETLNIELDAIESLAFILEKEKKKIQINKER